MVHFRPALGLIAIAVAALTPVARSSQPVLCSVEGGLDQTIRERVGLTAYTLQTLSLPDAAGEYVAFELTLSERVVRINVSLDPVDSPGCTMILDDGSGSPREVPAPAPCTYRGDVVGQPGSVVSGSILGGQFTGIVVLPGEQGAWNVLPLDQASPGADRAKHIVSRFEDSVAGNWRCGVADDAPVMPGLVPASAAPTLPGHTDLPYLCEIAIDADYQYFQQLNNSSSAVAQDISTVIANASSYAILSGCNLRFRIVRYVIRTSSAGNPGLYNTNDPTLLLQGLRQVWANLGNSIPRDITHMFTGRELSGVTIGIAYLGNVCSVTYGYALNQSRFSLQPGRRAAVAAHEIGHNFTARHCDDPGHLCTPCWLMTASQGNTTNELTRYGCATSIITGYIPTRNCIQPGDSGAPLQGAGCGADFDHSGTLSANDFAAFSAAMAAMDWRADIDSSGRLDINDYIAFLTAYSRGCR